MPIGEAINVLLNIAGARMAESGNPYGVALQGGLTVLLEPSRVTHSVRSIELYGGPATEPVILADLSLLANPADEVIRILVRGYGARVEDSGQFVVVDDLLVSLWRSYVAEGPDDPEGRYFESVLVASLGYYEGQDRLAEGSASNGGEANRVESFGGGESLF